MPLNYVRLALAIALLENRQPLDEVNTIDIELLNRFNRNPRDRNMHQAIVLRALSELRDPNDPVLTPADIKNSLDEITPEERGEIALEAAKGLRALFTLRYLGIDPEHIQDEGMKGPPELIAMDALMKTGASRHKAAKKVAKRFGLPDPEPLRQRHVHRDKRRKRKVAQG